VSRENVEALRRWIAAFNQRDIECMLGFFDPDIEWRPSGVFPGLDSVYVGHDEFKRFWSEFVLPWESLALSIDEVRDCGEEVLMLGSFEGEGRDGLQVRRRTASASKFRDRLFVRVRIYGDWDSALEAVGLRE
jgi:ketosteroid isomerase-like protein